MARVYEKGDVYRPNVLIEKTKNGIPTVMELSGRRYILQHEHQYVPKKNKKKGKK